MIKRSILVIASVPGLAWLSTAKAAASPLAAVPALYAAGSGATAIAVPFEWPLLVWGLTLLVSLCAGTLFILAWCDHRAERQHAVEQAAAEHASRTASSNGMRFDRGGSVVMDPVHARLLAGGS